MTDQPPPPSDKKPRRRSAPRKRSTAKRAPKTEAANTAAGVSTSPVDASTGGDAASSPEAIAERLDPTPLVDDGDRGDAPASDSPLAARDRKADAQRKQSQAKSDVARHSHDATAKSDEAAQAVAEPAMPPQAAPHAEPITRPDAALSAPSAAAVSATTPFPRQAELRPGELIRVPLSVRWRDLDAFNHVNNSKYLSYLEEARLRWMLAMPGMGMDDDVAPVVAASNLNYRRPIEWPGDVVIELFVERIGGSSLTIGHRIVDSKDGGTLYCDGNVVMVWIDRTSGRSAPLPESVRAACR